MHRFGGVNRRFTVTKEGALKTTPESDLVTIVDDYAHHPTEILATLSAARQAWPHRKIFGVFQPHRFTRLRDHWTEFSTCFDAIDQVIVCPVYTAGEKPIEGFDAEGIALKIGAKAIYAPSLDAAHTLISETLNPNDVVITLGAGNVNTLCASLGELIHG